jgi:hypothetical protein
MRMTGNQTGKSYLTKYALINSIETVIYENCKWLGPGFIYEANNRKDAKLTEYIKAGPNNFQIY